MTNMIVCPEPPAARVGREIFAKGGNGVDAAVAAAFAQGVTNPLLCGLGGTGILYYYDSKTRRRLIMDLSVEIGSVPVPSEWEQEYLGRAETVGRYILKSEANQVGYQSIMVPGFVRGLWDAFQRFGSGRVAWADLLAPAARLAKDGFEVYPYIAAFWRNDAARPGYPGLMTKLQSTPDAARAYLKPDGSVYDEGDWLVQSEMAETLEQLAKAGGEDFYAGTLARIISDDLESHAALICAEDLTSYRVRDDVPLQAEYRGLEVSSAPTPGSGAHLIEMLQIVEQLDLHTLPHNSPEYVDGFARAQRATFADNVGLKGMEIAQAQELEQDIVALERAAHWAERIRKGDRVVVHGGGVDGGTTHLTCVDAEHNVVSMTHSIGSLAGSGVMTPGLGFLYNNFLGHFNPLPGFPDSIAPRKRIGSIIPTIVFKDRQPYIAIGAPGGSRILTAVAQTIVNVAGFDMDMRTAVTAPRFHSEEEQLLLIEPAFSENTAHALRTLGNDVKRSAYMSRVQAIRIRDDTGELEAGADPRGGAGIGLYPPPVGGGG